MRFSESPGRRSAAKRLAHVTLLLVVTPGGSLSAQGENDFVALRTSIETYCSACHGGDTTKGDIDLSRVRSGQDMRRDANTWETALEQLESRFMPPVDRPAPTDAERERLVAGIRAILSENADATADIRPTLRRLSRVEYANTLRDLLGVTFDPKRLPADSPTHGFENVGDGMFLSASLFEKYVDATRDVLDLIWSDPERTRGLLGAAPEDDAKRSATTRRVLERFVTRAFRRPPRAAELDERIALVQRRLEAGDGWDQAMRTGFEATLLSPCFLYRMEDGVDESNAITQRTLTAHELATRLSYFLWSTMPDDALFAAADAGTLTEDDTLRSQTQRLLKDGRSRALADDFAAQWLGFREVWTAAVDYRRFLWIDDSLRHAMYAESALVFDTLVREDRPLVELLDADWTFLNDRLAKHYGIADVSGSEMRRVVLSDDRRGGLLGQASLLTTTSYPLRTSPVVRGRWVLERLLGEPPPPPPPNVAPLPEDDEPREGLTLRESLERHRQDPSCASCHDRMDPWGLALEPYDAAGRWRDAIHGRPIDAQASLPDGTLLDGPTAVKAALVKRRDAVARAFLEHLFVYAIGRVPRSTDRDTLDALLEQGREDDFRIASMIEAFVTSEAFRTR